MVNCHPEIIAKSAQGYVDQLLSSSSLLSESANQIVDNLVQSLKATMEMGEATLPGLILYNQHSLGLIPIADRARLINQYSLGLGTDCAKVIFVGTEHAYNLHQDLQFCLEASGLTLLWLTGGKREVIERLTGNPWPYPMPFHLHPNALYQVQHQRGQHTWIVLSKIMAGALGVSNWRNLLSRHDPGLGDVCYQVELSAYPAMQSLRGHAPITERIQFLCTMMSALRSTAQVLIFHGKPGKEPWDSYRHQVGRAFLGLHLVARSRFPKKQSREHHYAGSTGMDEG